MWRDRVSVCCGIVRYAARRVEQERFGESLLLARLHHVQRRCQRAAVDAAALE
jgi:hypothetical protein